MQGTSKSVLCTYCVNSALPILLTGWLMMICGQALSAPTNIKTTILDCPSPTSIAYSLLLNQTYHREEDLIFSIQLPDRLKTHIKNLENKSDPQFYEEAVISLFNHVSFFSAVVNHWSNKIKHIGCYYTFDQTLITLDTSIKANSPKTIIRIVPDASRFWIESEDTNHIYCGVRINSKTKTQLQNCRLRVTIKHDKHEEHTEL